MSDTIKAKYGFRVVRTQNIDTGEEGYRIYDGPNPLFEAQKRSYNYYIVEERNNEMFRRCEVFTTVKGNKFIYWRDDESDSNYITKIPNDNK